MIGNNEGNLRTNLDNLNPILNEIFNEFPEKQRGQLIPLLQRVQEKLSYLPDSAMKEIAHYLNLPPSKVYGVATFYNQFKFHAPGKYQIQICRGTACHVEGSKTVLDCLEHELKIKSGETSKDGLFSLEVVACIGACGLAPVISVNGEFHAKMNAEKIKLLVKELRKELRNENNN